MPAPTDAYGNLIWNETGLQSYWRFGELSGTSAADAKGTNTGTYQGTPTLGGAGIPADLGINSSVALNGTSQYISAATIDLTDGPLTLECWVKLTAINFYQSLICKVGTGTYYLQINNSNFPELAAVGVQDMAISSTALTDTSSWHHIVGTKTGTTPKIYLDGVDRTSGPINSVLVNTADGLSIGSRGGTTDWLHGSIDEVAIYNVVLDAATVATHFAIGIGQTARPTSDVLIGGWTTDQGLMTNEYSRINEVTANDTNYVQSSLVPAADPITFALGTLITPLRGQQTLKYRYAKDQSGVPVNLQVDLLQNGIVVQTWTHTDIPLAWTEADQIVTGITDFNLPLSITFTATQP